MKKAIKVKLIGNVKIFKDELKNIEDYETYKILYNSHVEREGTDDEYVSFNTINLKDLEEIKDPKPKNIKQVYQISQYAIQGSHCCDFGLYDDKDKAIQEMLSGVDKLYPGFKEEYWYCSNSDVWYYDEKGFYIRINTIEFNTFGEI